MRNDGYSMRGGERGRTTTLLSRYCVPRFALLAALAACGSGRAVPVPEPVESRIGIAPAEQAVVKNGVRSTYETDLRAIAPAERRAALDRAVRTIRTRLQLAGIAGRVALDRDNVVVDLATTDPEVMERAHELVRWTGRVELRVRRTGSALMNALAQRVTSDPVAAAAHITSETERWGPARSVTDWYLRASDREEALTADDARTLGCSAGMRAAPGERVVCRVSGRAVIVRYLAGLAKSDPAFVMPRDRVLAYERVVLQSDPRPFWRTLLVERTAVVTGASIQHATAIVDPESQRRLVQVDLDRADAKALVAAVETDPGRKLAVVIDDVVWVAPYLEDEIVNGHVKIPLALGDPEKVDREARDLAIVLTSGELPGLTLEASRQRIVDGVPMVDPQ